MSKGGETRELIIMKSAELFNQHGFEACSMAHIMKATGLKKGGIYNHFSSKEEIAIESFDYAFRIILKLFRKHLDSKTTSKGKVKGLINAFEDLILNSPIPGGCPVGNTAVFSNEGHSMLKQKSKKAFDTLIEYTRLKINEGIERNEFVILTDPLDEALIIISSLEGAVILSKVYGDMCYFDKIKNQLFGRIESWT
jgi:TetR/AcrR family transcriptional repressor of nem operon